MEEDGRLVQFIYNHRGEVITEESREAGLIRYIRGLGIVSSDSEQAKTYYHYVCDYAGSTSHVMNEQGNVENEYLYDAFGNITASAENVPNRFCYTGEQYDRIPNQYYLRARYYNPVIGRFTQQDTYLGAGLNLYAYCGGNPLSYVDPSGHEHHSSGDNAEKNDGYVQSPEALQQPSIQAWMDKCIKSQMDFVQEGVDAMTNNVYGKEGTSADPVQSAGSLSDVNSGPKTTALMVIDPPGSLVPALYKPFDYSTMGSQGGDANQTTALAPVAPFGSYEIVPFRNDTGTNPLDVAQSSAVAAAISDAGGGESGSNATSTQLSRRELAERKLADAANGSRAEGVLIGKDGDVPVYQSQQQLKKSIMDAGAQYMGPTRNNDGQIYHMNTPYGPVEIRIMQQKPGQTNPYLDNRTIIVEQGSVGNGTGVYTYGNGAPIRGAVSRSDRKAIGHTHGQTP